MGCQPNPLTRLYAAAVFVGVVTACLATSALAQSTSTLDEIKQRGTLKVGWTPNFPHAYLDAKSREMTGIAVDIMKNVAKELKVKLEWVEDAAVTLIAGLQADKYDLTVPLVMTLPRSEVVTYSKPFYQYGAGMMVQKGDLEKHKYQTWQDLDKKDIKVAVTLGSNVDTVATRLFQNASLVRVKDTTVSVATLLSGHVDALAENVDAFVVIKKEHPELAVVPNSTFAMRRMAFVVRRGDFVFRDWLNNFLDEYTASGELLRIIQKEGLDESFTIR